MDELHAFNGRTDARRPELAPHSFGSKVYKKRRIEPKYVAGAGAFVVVMLYFFPEVTMGLLFLGLIVWAKFFPKRLEPSYRMAVPFTEELAVTDETFPFWQQLERLYRSVGTFVNTDRAVGYNLHRLIDQCHLELCHAVQNYHRLGHAPQLKHALAIVMNVELPKVLDQLRVQDKYQRVQAEVAATAVLEQIAVEAKAINGAFALGQLEAVEAHSEMLQNYFDRDRNQTE